MNRLTTTAAALLVLALAATGTAGIDEGDYEFRLGGHWMSGDFESSFGGEITLGYFVSPEIEVGMWLGYAEHSYDGKVHVDGEGPDEDIDSKGTTVSFAVFGAYHFETDGEWMPYVGGFAGYERSELDTGDYDLERDGYTLGAFVGIKWFVSDRATVFFEYRLTWNDNDEWDDSGAYARADEFTHLFLVGVSVLF
jgi:hypothetical protein